MRLLQLIAGVVIASLVITGYVALTLLVFLPLLATRPDRRRRWAPSLLVAEVERI